jgi:hypothetical protein
MTRRSRVCCGHIGYSEVERTDPNTEYVAKYASKDSVDEAEDESDSGDDMSSAGSYASDEEPAGAMEEV